MKDACLNFLLSLESLEHSHLALNGADAALGHYTNWEIPESHSQLIQAVALPLIVGLGVTLLKNPYGGSSFKSSLEDFVLDASFYTVSKLYSHREGHNPKRYWYEQVLMGGSFALGALSLIKKCSKHVLQSTRSPHFPYRAYCFYDVAKSILALGMTHIADRCDIAQSEKVLRNLTVLYLAGVSLLHPTHILTGVKLEHDPINMTRNYVIAAIALRSICK